MNGLKKLKKKISKYNLTRVKEALKNFRLKYIRPDLDEEVDEEFTTAHQVINLCPGCGHSNCIIKTPHGTFTFQNIFTYRMWKEHTFNCMRCSYVSKVRKVSLDV